jgi:aryl-alcohol dehydrogenase-like predicted oxidoreductase
VSTESGTGVRRVRLGTRLEVSALGLGCMGMAEFYGPTDEQESVATIEHAVDHGIDFVDTAYMYGGGRSEQIVGKALTRIGRERVTLSTKCGLVRTETGVRVDGNPDHIRAAVDESLGRLDTDHVDLLYLHRVDPGVPVEESIGAMSDLAASGKARLLGISEAGEDSLRRAHATHPMAVLQSEFSLCTREPQRTLLPVCRELGIGFVAWGPLSRGLLTGQLTETRFAADDIRSVLPRFAPQALAHNLELVDRLAGLAARSGLTLAQLALAWIVAQGVVPIPGAMNRSQFDENLVAAGTELDPEVLTAVDALAPEGAFAGDRFHAPMLATVEK